MLYRQGDVYFKPIRKIPAGPAKKRKDGAVAYGEVTGHSHRLAVEAPADRPGRGGRQSGRQERSGPIASRAC